MVGEYYVYIHRKATDGSIFYVGKGCKKRAYDTYNRNVYWNKVVTKHGFTAEILFSGMSNADTNNVEVDVIKELRYMGEKLTNMTNGGEGTSGFSLSDSTKEKIRLKHLGKRLTEDHKKRIKDGVLLNARRGEKHPRFGVYADKCKDSIKIRYEFVNSTTGEVFIGIRSSFVRSFGLDDSNVGKMCNGHYRSVKGWYINQCLLTK
jgi:hypothetical protein